MNFVKPLLFLGISGLTVGYSFSQEPQQMPPSIKINTNKQLHQISPLIYGQFLEPIYDSVVGGLDGQLLRSPSFEEQDLSIYPPLNPQNGFWELTPDGLTTDWCGWLAGQSGLYLSTEKQTDFDLEFQLRKDKPGWHGAFIIFAAKDPQNQFRWNLGNWGPDRPALEQITDGKSQDLPQTENDIKLKVGQWHQVRLTCKDNTLTGSFDGNKILSTTVEDLTVGDIGIGTCKSRCTFNNIQLDGKPVLPDHPHNKEVSPPWEIIDESSKNTNYHQKTDTPLNSSRYQYLRIDGNDTAGIQQGDISLTAHVPVKGSVYLKGNVSSVTITLQQAGKTTPVTYNNLSENWTQYDFQFTPTSDTDTAILKITATGPGELSIDQCIMHQGDSIWRKEIYDTAVALKPGFIRWPGGCYAEHYRWKDAIGPLHKRQTRPNNMWGGLDPNHIGTREFLQLCEETGAEPIIVINIGMHEPDDTLDQYIQEAVDWLEYCNSPVDTPYGALRAKHGHPSPYHVKYWEIGNETWGIGIDRYTFLLEKFVAALKDKDPNIKIIACGSADHDLKWTQDLLDRVAHLIDYISPHHYQGGSYQETIADARFHYPEAFRQWIKSIENSKNPNIKIACTEWNDMSISLRGGIYAGILLNEFEKMSPYVPMTCPALFLRHTKETDWNNAFINHDSKHCFVSPSYLVMKLYNDHFADTMVACEAPEQLNVVATIDKDTSTVILKVVNFSKIESYTPPIHLDGKQLTQTAQRWIITSDKITDENSMNEPRKVAVKEEKVTLPATFPPRSITVLKFNKTRD